MATQKEDRLHIRISKDLKADIYKEAQRKGLSISSYIRSSLKQQIDNQSYQQRLNKNMEKK